MKKRNNLLILLSLLLCVGMMCGCKKKHKPSPRPEVYNADTVPKKKIKHSANSVVVPFKRTEGNLYEIVASINGVPFNMWWDTGASITSISALEALSLYKQGKLKDEDLGGNTWSRVADGRIVPNTVLHVYEILIEGQDNRYVKVNNVDILIQDSSIAAPVLLGQDVISQLPRHTFDEKQGTIIFEPK